MNANAVKKKPLLTVPRALLVATLAGSALGCPRPVAPGAEAGLDVAAPEAAAEDAGAPEEEVMADATAPVDGDAPDPGRVCVPGPGPDGAIELTYLDGATVGYGQFFADGGSQIFGLDGGLVGSFMMDENGFLTMGGPCSRLV